MSLTKNAILATKQNSLTSVDIDGVGTVHIRKLSYDDVMGYIRGQLDEDERFIMVRMIIAGVCDDSGVPLFERSDESEVGGLDMHVVRKLAEAVQQHGGMDIGDDTVGN